MRNILLSALILMSLISASRADEGMWIPMLLNELNEAEMQAMGMTITADDIYNINQSSLKDAIMIFGGGCTAELISDQGLILTNHHCGYSRIQRHSSLEHNYLEDGFWAMSHSEELPNAGLTVTFLVKMEDVTDAIIEGVTHEMSEAQRAKTIKINSEKVVEEAIKNTHYKALVKPFFQGNQYFLFINEVFEDVRLVGAPPSSIGKFGGDTDNWVWPRHTGDFSIFRIYADSNNMPAAYSEDNVPYHPKRHLNISLGGVQEDDFTFVFGYPGSTQEYLPSWGVDLQVNTINPIRIGLRDKRIAIFNEFMNKSEEIRLNYSAKHASISNGWKKWIGENRGIKRLKAIEQKQKFEQEFIRWANSTNELKDKYGNLLPAFKSTYQEAADLQYNATYIRETLYGIEILRHANGYKKLVETSKEKGKRPEMEIQLEKVKNSMAGFYKEYCEPLDKRVFVDVLREYYTHVEFSAMPKTLLKLHSKFKGDFNLMAEWFYQKSIFASEEKIGAILDNYKKNSWKIINRDPAYQMAIDFSGLYNDSYLPDLRFESAKIDSLMRLYMQAQMDMQPMKKFYPDANFTLRVAYGNVKGFSPDDAKNYRYFTTLDGIIEKENPEIYDYEVEDKLKELYQNQDYGPYMDSDGSLHVCFIATNHTTGGNSGSPVLDANGNLIGLNFDRCWESTMSDLVYDIEQCRNIALDIRYCLFVIDKFAGAGHLVEEMTIIE
ncbi:MAG: S46 family peptidase [Bacteroidales bacterium]|nr:S46 family peptidase [Bacteroidales bacterium]MCF8404697.1 S46 family peptidase [Bacteroidales bacterium]